MNVQLVLNTSPALEDDLMDFLASRDNGQAFTYFPVFGHGSGLHGMSIAEQVSGRRRRVQFELVLDESEVEQLLDDLREQLGGDITFWQLPVQRFGRLS